MRVSSASKLCVELAEEAEEAINAAEEGVDLSIYRTDPVGYAVLYLGLTLTPDQEEILRSLVGNRRTAVKANHAAGKTFIAAVAACWWYDCWDEHIVYITAPTWGQALGLTFKAITRLRREKKLSGVILDTGLIRDEDKYRAGAHFIKALNAETGEGFQGEHTSDILLLYEEAVGVPGYIWEAGDGLMTSPGCRLLAIANPTDESTLFGLACSQHDVYHVITLCGLVHPNIIAQINDEEMPFPKAISLEWLWEMIRKECEPSEPGGDAFEFPAGSGDWWMPNAIFQGRVLGEFPSQADAQVIPRGWLTNLPQLIPGILPEIGCDVARKGRDRTAIAARADGVVLSLLEVRKLDNIAVANKLKTLADELAAEFGCNAQKIPIRIDVTGGLGTGPLDLLTDWGYNAIGVNSSSDAIDKENFPRKRHELWWVVRDRARSRDLDLSRLPRELRERLIRELSTPTWKSDSRARKVVEDKDEMKKRLAGASPDLAEAVCLSFDGSGANWDEILSEMDSEEQEMQQSRSRGRNRDEEDDYTSEALSVQW